jgi:hypothetical protein
MMALDPAALLAAYDGQLRVHTPERVPAGYTIEPVGPLSRWTGPRSGFIVYRDLAIVETAASIRLRWATAVTSTSVRSLTSRLSVASSRASTISALPDSI